MGLRLREREFLIPTVLPSVVMDVQSPDDLLLELSAAIGGELYLDGRLCYVNGDLVKPAMVPVKFNSTSCLAKELHYPDLDLSDRHRTFLFEAELAVLFVIVLSKSITGMTFKDAVALVSEEYVDVPPFPLKGYMGQPSPWDLQRSLSFAKSFLVEKGVEMEGDNNMDLAANLLEDRYWYTLAAVQLPCHRVAGEHQSEVEDSEDDSEGDDSAGDNSEGDDSKGEDSEGEASEQELSGEDSEDFEEEINGEV
jgi:hypothetical protein